jgi:hypothetical protein
LSFSGSLNQQKGKELLTAIGFASRVNGWMHYGFFSFLSVLSKLNKL